MTLYHLHDVAEMHERREDLRADADMLLHVLEFFSGKRPFLINHGVSRPDLTQIMEPAGQADALAVVLGRPELRGVDGREVVHPGGLTAPKSVFGLESVYDRV